MGKCIRCGTDSRLISESLSLCRTCILEDFEPLKPHIQRIHRISREGFDLPPEPPEDEGGISCGYCFNQCLIGEGSIGYCGVRENRDGKRLSPSPREGRYSWYYDLLPTNCVAAWVCPGGTGSGFPDYSYCKGPEYGHKNLAVFYYGCTLNCLFCQNWSHKQGREGERPRSSAELVQNIDERTSCVCYFGGDPSPHLPHSIRTTRLARAQNPGKILRFCWETNGSMNRRFLEEILDLALESGGCVKFDLKTYDLRLNMALCGRPNHQTKENFELAANWFKRRKEPPLVVASTLLVPGYVEREEISKAAHFLAALNPEIPYALLGFYPHFFLKDLPRTSRRHAQECREVALEAGLKRVRIGNIHLLGDDY